MPLPRRLAVLAALIAALAVAGCAPPATTPISSLAKPSAQQQAETVTPTPEPELYTPTPRDFTITVKILKRECFGSAGCNITYRIDPRYSGGDITSDQKFDVIYEVRGGEDGPVINTLSIDGDQVSWSEEEYVSVPSARTKLTAKVTEVLTTN